MPDSLAPAADDVPAARSRSKLEATVRGPDRPDYLSTSFEISGGCPACLPPSWLRHEPKARTDDETSSRTGYSKCQYCTYYTSNERCRECAQFFAIEFYGLSKC